MRKKYLKVVSISLLLSCVAFGSVGCACGGKEYKITFVSEGNSDIVRYVKKGKTLVDIPQTPDVKGKYCLWDSDDFQNIQENRVVTALCYSKVANLYTNMPNEIDVEVFSQEADLENIFKDLEMEATFESGEEKKIYKGEYTLLTGDYNKDVSGEYLVSLIYNDARKDIKINVNKIDNYATISLNSGTGYYNEGLPSLVANTNVEGVIAFDQGQDLYIGNRAYKWTFTPKDQNKYAIMHGQINVNLLGANSISANKSNLTVGFGASKSEIIDKIKEGLIVQGKFGNTYKDIDSAFYTIDSDNFVVNKSGTFDFRISYASDIYTTVYVNVEKCNTYTLNVANVDEFILKEDTTLDDIANSLIVDTNVEGNLSLKSGQILSRGVHEYEYVFTPTDSHYAEKSGKVSVNLYVATALDFTNINEFEYGTAIEIVETALRESIIGKVTYNDTIVRNIDVNKVNISVANYNSSIPGSYQYSVSYDGEIAKFATFTLDKINLEKGVDYTIACESVDPDDYASMPYCSIQRSSSSNQEFDPDLFSIVPIVGEEPIDIGTLGYKYKAELVPDDTISYKFNNQIIEVIAMKN